ncbi:MAG: PKD domain-containing protein, partial [Marmoricola sp.]|nr:PKD domain-containing protein [Marmoricola sp.]
GTGSSDSDGTVKTWTWDFGDGGSGTGATTTHQYAKAGTYAVKLTVTDDKGATGSKTQNVDVVMPNQKPTASFTWTTNGTTVNVDGSTSSDPDGTVTSYAWDFGDTNNPSGDTATGKTASYQYSQPGSYTVTLTVTDNQSLSSDPVTHQVAVSAQTFIANDTFNRTVGSGWGNADVGGPWTVATGQAAKFAVTPGAGTLTLPPSTTQRIVLGSVSSSSATTSAEFTMDKVPTGTGTGDSLYAAVIGRRVGADEYAARLTLDGAGNGRLWLLRDNIGMASAVVPGAFAADTQYTVKIAVTGTNPVTIAAKAWPSSGTEPATWQVTKTDTGTTAPTINLQSPGAVGIWGYVAPGSSNVTTASPLKLTFDAFTAQ